MDKPVSGNSNTANSVANSNTSDSNTTIYSLPVEDTEPEQLEYLHALGAYLTAEMIASGMPILRYST